MGAPPAGISEADWLATPVAVRALLLALQEEIEQLRAQFTALATELANLRERIGRSSRNSSKPPSSDGPGFKPPERRKGSGRKRGGQPGHPGAGPELLPMERVDDVVEHHPDACRRCGMLLQGEDPAPLRHQVIEIPPITPVVIEHRLRHLAGGCGSHPLWAQAQCPGGSAGQCLPLEFQQDPGAAQSATGGRDQLRDDRNDPPGSERRAGAGDARGPGFCPSAAGGLCR